MLAYVVDELHTWSLKVYISVISLEFRFRFIKKTPILYLGCALSARLLQQFFMILIFLTYGGVLFFIILLFFFSFQFHLVGICACIVLFILSYMNGL